MAINRKLRGIRDPVDPGYILGRPKNMGRGPAVQLKAPTGLLAPNQTLDVQAGLPASGVTAGSYTNANITVNEKGLVTAAGNGTSGLPALTDGKIWIGNGTNVAVERTLSGDVTTSNTGVTALANTAVAAGSYTNTNLTVDAKGRITAAANGTGGSGSWVQIGSTQNASNVASVNFGLLDLTPYDEVEITALNVVCATDSKDLWLRIGTGGTPTYQGGASDYSYSGQGAFGTSGATAFAEADTTFDAMWMPLLSVSNVAGEVQSGSVRLSGFTTSLFTVMYGTGGGFKADNATINTTVSGRYNTKATITGFQLLMSSGNITSGKFILRGRPTA